MQLEGFPDLPLLRRPGLNDGRVQRDAAVAAMKKAARPERARARAKARTSRWPGGSLESNDRAASR